ncbi:MAG: hypothetical protein AABY15_03675 [Nanoarchaeota archaeon]
MIKINFKKITALATSALMVGMTMGVAAAANYPAPFVSGGAADVAIVYGTGSGVSQLDLIEAGNVQTNLQSFMTGTTGGGVSTTGELVSLDTSADRIWLNTSLNAVKSTITKTDLPTILSDYTFSGNVDSKITSTIKLIAGTAPGLENSGKVVFAKQPSSSNDPVIGISMGSSAAAQPLYNATATMAAINFTSADSEGEEIVLFGQSFTVASATDTDTLVLLKEAEKVSLSSDLPASTVTVGGESYTIELVSASDTSATVKVTNSAGKSESKEVSEAASKKINGVTIAVQTADETNLKLSASVIAGAEKVTLEDAATVTVGESNNPIDGTLVYLNGGNTGGGDPTNSTTEIAIAVFRPDSTHDAILPGESFVDPVFGSFKFDFVGLTSPLDDVNRDTISLSTAGDDTVTVKFTEQGGSEKSVDFAHNESLTWRLADDSNFSIGIVEMENLSYATGTTKYVVVGNEDYGHLLELYDVYNQSTGSSSVTNDRVKFKDVFSGTTYETTFTSTESEGTLDVDGKRYTVYFNGTGESASVKLKYPTSDSVAGNGFVLFPTIETKSGALVQFYQPTTINLSDINGTNNSIFGDHMSATNSIYLPDGDGYVTAIATTYNTGSNATDGNWTVGSTILNTTGAANAIHTLNYSVITVGAVRYNFTNNATNGSNFGTGGVAGVNKTTVYMVNPAGTGNIDQPALIVWENKDNKNEYHVVVVDLEDNAASMGSSTNGVGVSGILLSSDYYNATATRASDSDFSDYLDWFGTHSVINADDSDQKKATITYPKSQVYSQLYIGASGSTVSGGVTAGGSTQLGNVLVKDSEVSSVATKNLVIVGGSCINSAAATLVGGAKCGAAWTTATGVGAGEFLLKGYATSTLTSKVALLVAGYEAADTVNAATYLRTKTVDTSKAYKGTTSTSATLVNSTA